jgi:hypothetical protein
LSIADATTRSGRTLAQDRKNDDIGRAEVRHKSMLQALMMLNEPAAMEEPHPPAGAS